MDMAGLPAKTNKSSAAAASTTRRDKIRKLIRRGYTSGQIATKLAGDDQMRKKQIRQEVRVVMQQDEEYQAMRALAIKGAFVEELDGVAEAVGRRARRGRIDAAKLMLEVTGIHNPRVQHEHSGDIKITLDLPRPARQLDEIGPADDIV